MSGSRASLAHEQRLCVEEIDRTGRLYWMIRIPASEHLRRMGATATSVSYAESCLESALSHTLPLDPHLPARVDSNTLVPEPAETLREDTQAA